MDILDQPAALKYNNGNLFPQNLLILGYILLGASLLALITAAFIAAGIVLLVGLFIVTNRHIVEINTEQNFVHDYSQYLGFVKIGKKYPLNKYKYVTTMPLVESHKLYGNSAQSMTVTNSHTTVTLFGEGLRGKRIITKFDTKNEATELASKLGTRLNIKYFEYDPKLVRAVLLGQKTL